MGDQSFWVRASFRLSYGVRLNLRLCQRPMISDDRRRSPKPQESSLHTATLFFQMLYFLVCEPAEGRLLKI